MLVERACDGCVMESRSARGYVNDEQCAAPAATISDNSEVEGSMSGKTRRSAMSESELTAALAKVRRGIRIDAQKSQPASQPSIPRDMGRYALSAPRSKSTHQRHAQD